MSGLASGAALCVRLGHPTRCMCWLPWRDRILPVEPDAHPTSSAAGHPQTRRDWPGDGYDAFRTGLTFRTARRMLHGQPARNNPGRWRDKTRRSVLGFMHEIKLQLWFQIQDANEGG